MQNQGLISNSMRGSLAAFSRAIISTINLIGMVVGLIATNLLDVVLGGIVLSNFLSNFFTPLGNIPILGISLSITGSFLGWVISIAFWFIQMILWDRVLINNRFDWSKEWMAILAGIAIGIVDTIIDSSIIFVIASDSTFLRGIDFFGYELHVVVTNSLFFAVVLITGLNDLLNQLFIRNFSQSGRSMPSFGRGGMPPGMPTNRPAPTAPNQRPAGPPTGPPTPAVLDPTLRSRITPPNKKTP